MWVKMCLWVCYVCSSFGVKRTAKWKMTVLSSTLGIWCWCWYSSSSVDVLVSYAWNGSVLYFLLSSWMYGILQRIGGQKASQYFLVPYDAHVLLSFVYPVCSSFIVLYSLTLFTYKPVCSRLYSLSLFSSEPEEASLFPSFLPWRKLTQTLINTRRRLCWNRATVFIQHHPNTLAKSSVRGEGDQETRNRK